MKDTPPAPLSPRQSSEKENYSTYKQLFFDAHNNGKSWHYGEKFWVTAFTYHDGDWKRTLSLASALYHAYMDGFRD